MVKCFHLYKTYLPYYHNVIIYRQTLFSSILRAGEYEYPFDEGSPEWRNLSVEERHSMRQIPNQDLATIDTDMLVSAYVNNPYCSLIFAHNTINLGFNRVYNEFNGLRELMNRPDAGEKILAYYEEMNVNDLNQNWSEYEKGNFTFKFIYIEVLLSQPQILNQLSDQQSKRLIGELINKYNVKNDHIAEHSGFGLSYTTYSMAKYLMNKNKLFEAPPPMDNELQHFLDLGVRLKADMAPYILQRANLNLVD